MLQFFVRIYNTDITIDYEFSTIFSVVKLANKNWPNKKFETIELLEGISIFLDKPVHFQKNSMHISWLFAYACIL